MFKQVDPKSLDINVFSTIDDQWMLITAGTAEKCNTMTASWGGLGILWNLPMATAYIRPQRYTKQFVDENEYFTLTFFSEDYRKQLTDHIHSKGRVATLHSCGHNADRIQCFIDGGFDQWAPQPMNDIKKLYREYGDKIVLAVWPDPIDWANTTEEEQRAHARKFVEEFNQPGKPSTLGFGDRQMTPAFLEEVYIHSRKLFAERG